MVVRVAAGGTFSRPFLRVLLRPNLVVARLGSGACLRREPGRALTRGPGIVTIELIPGVLPVLQG